MLCWILTNISKVQSYNKCVSSTTIHIRITNSSGSGVCLEDVPAQGEFDVDSTALVGLDFNADEQCRAQYGPTAVFCPFNFATDVRSLYSYS